MKQSRIATNRRVHWCRVPRVQTDLEEILADLQRGNVHNLPNHRLRVLTLDVVLSRKGKRMCHLTLAKIADRAFGHADLPPHSLLPSFRQSRIASPPRLQVQ